MIVIRATFEGTPNKHYNYLCRFLNVKVGETVIVESPYNGYTAVKIVAVHNVGDTAAGRPTKEVVCRIDDAEYLKRKQAKARLDEITAELEKREKEVKAAQAAKAAVARAIDYDRFRPLAQMDGMAHKLVDEAVQIEQVLRETETRAAYLPVSAAAGPWMRR